MAKSRVLWTLAEAQALIAGLEPAIRELNYHTLLGGGVLHTGSSDHDLDIWLLPLNGHESNVSSVWQVIAPLFGPLHAIRDSPDYKAGEPWHIREAVYGNYLGKRVDVFVL